MKISDFEIDNVILNGIKRKFGKMSREDLLKFLALIYQILSSEEDTNTFVDYEETNT